MSHLTLEALARLLDEPPGEAERRHLVGCTACRMELQALRGQTEALAALPTMVPTPDVWPELRERLKAEGVVREVPARTERAGPSAWSGRRTAGALRAAAAAFLFLGGGALGYVVRGEATTSPGVPGVAGPLAATGSSVAERVEPEQVAPDLNLRQVEEAQEAFFSALDQYMAATGSQPSDPAARLAALDNIVLTTAEALNEAPADPVINSFYLTAMAQRNAMFRQMTTTADPVF